MKVVIYGPNPADPSRTGGVARHMEYLGSLRSVSIDDRLRVSFAFIDHHRFLRWPKIARRLAGILSSCIVVLFSKSDDTVLHVNTSLQPVVAFRDCAVVAVARIRRIPTIVQAHGGRLSNFRAGTLSNTLWRYILESASKILVFPGPAASEFIEEGYTVECVPNMVPDSGVRVDLTASPVVLFLGRLVEAKGPLVVLRAFKQLVEKHGRIAKLMIVGGGELHSTLVSENASDEFADLVQITGFLSGQELETIVNQANVFILPSSYQEGFPLSFLECAEKGMACMVSTGSAIPTYFVADEEYLEVDTGDVAGLVHQMEKVVLDDAARFRIGNAARNKVKSRFLVSQVVEKFRTIYAGVLNTRLAHPKEAVKN